MSVQEGRLQVGLQGRLQEKVAIVVGAGQTPGDTIGNGRATALRFAEEGARLLVVDRRMDRAEETLALVREYGVEAQAAEADIRHETQAQRVIEACMRHFGRIDVLHNNVGVGGGDAGPSHITEEAWDRIHETNLKGAVFTCKHALPVMRAQRSGVITNISSIAAVCSVGMIGYKTSKAALNAFTQSLAMGNAEYGIRANAIMPGLMETPMAIEGFVAAGADRAAVIERRNQRVPLGGRMGTAWDVANAALFLASNEARFITGVCLPVDGGQSARIG